MHSWSCCFKPHNHPIYYCPYSVTSEYRAASNRINWCIRILIAVATQHPTNDGQTHYITRRLHFECCWLNSGISAKLRYAYKSWTLFLSRRLNSNRADIFPSVRGTLSPTRPQVNAIYTGHPNHEVNSQIFRQNSLYSLRINICDNKFSFYFLIQA